MMTTDKRIFYRQGDILFEKVNDFLDNMIKMDEHERTVAKGELTNHHHSFGKSEQVILYRDKKNNTDPVYVEVLQEQSTITHQEHAPLTLEKGTYKITREREYNPFLDMIQQTVD